MFATVSTDISSYEAIHGCMPLHSYRSTISDMFCIRDFMTYPFPTRHDTEFTHGYPTDLSALIASVKCLDMSIELRLTVTETILCGFQWPIVQRRVATPKKEKSYGLEIYESQMQRDMN